MLKSFLNTMNMTRLYLIPVYILTQQTPLLMNQSPSPREKSVLLVKLMQYVEKRFPDDSDLNAHFLELVNWVYR